MNDATRTVDDELAVPQPGDQRLRNAMELVPMAPSRGDMLAADLTRSQVLAKDLMMMPPHLHGQPSTILSIIELARHWNMVPVMVAKQTYVPKTGQFSFMSQLLHAVLEQNAPIKHRLRFQFGRLMLVKQEDGTSVGKFVVDLLAPPDERRCRVYTTVRGEDEPVEYISPPFSKIQPKNSPLWQSDPDQQQIYRSVTMFGRRYFPDILMGCYTAEEQHLIEVTLEDPKKAILERLEAQKASASPREGMEVPQETPQAPPEKPQAAPKAKVATTEPPKVDKRSKAYKEAQKAAPQPEPDPEDHDPETGEVIPDPEPEVVTADEVEAQMEAAAEEPAEEESVKAPTVQPKDPESYRGWVVAWLKALDSKSPKQEMRSIAEQSIRDRWKAEMALRNQCQVTADLRGPILALVNEVIAKLQPAEE